MKIKKTFLQAIIFIALPLILTAQDNHRWKPLDASNSRELWYDSTMLDSIDGNKLDVWVLQMHKSPLEFEGIADSVYRSETLYGINMGNAKYGIFKVIYFNQKEEEIFSYDYNNPNLSDDIKYTYPILEGSFLHLIVKEYFKMKGEEIN